MFWKVYARKVKKHLKNYIWQCFLATVAVFIILMIFNLYDEAVIVAAFGSTAFTAFAMPKSWMARSRNIIGGHLIGILVGVSMSFLYRINWTVVSVPLFDNVAHVLIAALSITFAMFLMIFLDYEHAPAAGTALALTITPFSLNTIFFVIFVAFGIAVFKWFFRDHLIDLV
ncbi:MAG: HPP family protein [Candidatus Margulisbacteria bacterium]|nr:HPP family protein [Candidatus Margulisiibacteriota bacterium]MBU1021358.1 HPP family protein [Candidatus Margulisiibacteriota bacterium]MBU1729153.1 HPP family protein [Candidatus Margulisiibacteriota bacterium]MBU1954826.1 HPP family protein [Candidatus Margulisiibacteriota bacterium]